MLYIPSWTTRTSWNHNDKLYVEARSRTDLIITFIVSLDIVRGMCIFREKTDFLTCGPGSGMPIVTLRVLEWAAGRWRHAAEELLGCRSLWAA